MPALKKTPAAAKKTPAAARKTPATAKKAPTTARKTPAKKAPAKPAADARTTAMPGPDVTKALDALSDAIGRAQLAAKAVRTDLLRSPLRANVARDVERLIRDLRRDAAKLDRAVRADLRKAMGTGKPTAKKPAPRKRAAG